MKYYCINCGKETKGFGKHCTSCAHIGIYPSKETKRKISEGTKGKLMGEKNPAKRPEVKRKISLRVKEIWKDPKLRKERGDKIKKALSNPKVRKKMSIQIRKALSDPKVRKKMIKANNSPKAVRQSLKNGYGKKCHYNNEFFPSLQERDCYIYIIKLGYKVIHNFLHRFDFLVVLTNGKKVVIEFHPYDRTGLTNKQYYNQRRKLLDKYGYKDLKLVVIKDLKEIENKLEKLC